MRVAKRLMTHPPPSHEKGKDRNLFQKISIFAPINVKSPTLTTSLPDKISMTLHIPQMRLLLAE